MKSASKLLIAVGSGLAIGGILGVLFAPDKGSETRRKLSERGKKISEKVKEKIREEREQKQKRFKKVNGEVEEFE
jgi:gas vesicle protein